MLKSKPDLGLVGLHLCLRGRIIIAQRLAATKFPSLARLAGSAAMAGCSPLALLALGLASTTALRVNVNQVARVGSSWPSSPRFSSPASLDFCPFALSQNFPARVFAEAPAVVEHASPSVTLLLDDLCHTVGSIGTIGAEVGVTLRYLRLPSTGKVRVLALGSSAALHLFVKKATHRWSDDLRVTWAKA